MDLKDSIPKVSGLGPDTRSQGHGFFYSKGGLYPGLARPLRISYKFLLSVALGSLPLLRKKERKKERNKERKKETNKEQKKDINQERNKDRTKEGNEEKKETKKERTKETLA